MYTYRRITEIRNREKNECNIRSLFFNQRGSASVLMFIGQYNLLNHNCQVLSFLHHRNQIIAAKDKQTNIVISVKKVTVKKSLSDLPYLLKLGNLTKFMPATRAHAELLIFSASSYQSYAD